MELTVDTNVLVKADAKGDPALKACFVFLEEFTARDDRLLALDEGGLVEAQYRRHLKPTRYGYQWLAAVLRRKRSRSYRRAPLPKPARIRLLDECHMHPADLNLFVRVALASPSKRIITHDGDFWGAARRVIHHDLQVSVDSADSIHQELCGGPLDDCYAECSRPKPEAAP